MMYKGGSTRYGKSEGLPQGARPRGKSQFEISFGLPLIPCISRPIGKCGGGRRLGLRRPSGVSQVFMSKRCVVSGCFDDDDPCKTKSRGIYSSLQRFAVLVANYFEGIS
ncbi:hypothetical protein J6590_052172 [Homalodisca vitripennis]|nr:hypothetical protein J6590_052172 [Homalodisca vitripennis]